MNRLFGSDMRFGVFHFPRRRMRVPLAPEGGSMHPRGDQAGRRAMALDEGVELESVKKPLGEAGDILGLWQDDDGRVGLTFASDLKPEGWKASLWAATLES